MQHRETITTSEHLFRDCCFVLGLLNVAHNTRVVVWRFPLIIKQCCGVRASVQLRPLARSTWLVVISVANAHLSALVLLYISSIMIILFPGEMRQLL